jgi:serine/threonine protein kinase
MSDSDNLDPEQTLVTEHFTRAMKGDLKPGAIVGGNYRIKSVIGRGGMGVVYCAEHLAIHRDYALKALAPDRVNEANWQRFQAEGKTIAMLDHRNIVKVYDMGTDGPDCLYYVMDLLHGVSLAEIIASKGILELGEALEIFSQLCAGLGYAHKLGLVHRDVKPSNIILLTVGPGRTTPLVKIIDYGLVKLVGEANQTKQSLTATGNVCGSPFYMSPEQSMGGKIDERTDIYSLGCTLFECLTGEPPFRGSSGLETALMHQSDVPRRLNDLRPDKKYPENLEQMIGRMLQKIPAQRYQSMDQVSQDLLRVSGGKTVNREALFTDVPLFEIDTSVEAELEAPDRKTSLPVAWICAVGAFVTLFAVWAAVSHFSARDQTQASTKAWVGRSSHPEIISGRQETPEIKHAQEVFDACPQISNGVVEKDGVQERVFHFPEVPVGVISWGYNGACTRIAQGEVRVPAAEPVTLQLPRSEGRYVRMFPAVLAKIGPDDIYALEVKEPQTRLEDDDTLSFEVPVELVKAISKWKALHKINFYHCKVTRDALLALNDLSSTIAELALRDSPTDGKSLAQVKWLNRLISLDAKGIDNVDAVLHVLAGAPQLRALTIDATLPSKAGLKALATCPNLQSLSLAEAEVDDQKFAAVCDITSLISLNVKRCQLHAKSIDEISKLKRLQHLNIAFLPIDEADARKLKQALPGCKITYEAIRSARPADFLGGGH